MNRYEEKRSRHSDRGEYQDFAGREKRVPAGHKRRRRLSGRQKALITICILMAVALGGVVAYKGLFVRPDLSSILPTSSKSENGMAPKVSGERKSKDFYTILLLGRDTGGGGNCDTMMLVSYDVTNQKMNVMSIPRDTMVNVPWDVKKINSVYNMEGGGNKGIKALDKEISDLLGFVPDYSVIVEWAAVGKLVNAIGGVYFDVPRNMDYEDPTQDLSIHLKKGYQKLNGQQAMEVVRFRDGKNGYKNGDLGRIETQQNFMKAVFKQLLEIKNVSRINEFSKIFEENVKTDLSVQNLFWFGKSAIMGGLSMDNVNFITMPNTNTSCWSRTYHNYQSYVVPKAAELLEMVNNKLSPFKEEVTLTDLDIMSVNKDGSISSTTGHVEDSRAAVRPSIPTGTSKRVVDNTKTGSVVSEKGTSSSEKSGSSGSKTGSTSSDSTGSGSSQNTASGSSQNTGSTGSGTTGGNTGTGTSTGTTTPPTGTTGTTGTDTATGTGTGTGTSTGD